jgi:hypothetical protein
MWVYGGYNQEHISRATAEMGHLVLVGVGGSDGRHGTTTSVPETFVRSTTTAAVATIRTQMRSCRAQGQRVRNDYWTKTTPACQRSLIVSSPLFGLDWSPRIIVFYLINCQFIEKSASLKSPSTGRSIERPKNSGSSSREMEATVNNWQRLCWKPVAFWP